MNPNNLMQPGDLIFTQDTTWVSRVIRWGERDRGENDVFAGHAMVGGWAGQCISARPPRVGTDKLADYGKIRIYRLRLPTPERSRIADMAYRFIGKQYGTWKLAVHCVSHVPGLRFLRRSLCLEGFPICSMVVACALRDAIGITEFGTEGWSVTPDAAQPDDLERWARAKTTLVYEGSGNGE